MARASAARLLPAGCAPASAPLRLRLALRPALPRVSRRGARMAPLASHPDDSASSVWAQLLSLRSPLLRDAGAALACPPLLRASRELPCAARLPVGARGGWAAQLACLKELDAAPPVAGSRAEAALARLAAFKQHRRLGVYFQVRSNAALYKYTVWLINKEAR